MHELTITEISAALGDRYQMEILPGVNATAISVYPKGSPPAMNKRVGVYRAATQDLALRAAYDALMTAKKPEPVEEPDASPPAEEEPVSASKNAIALATERRIFLVDVPHEGKKITVTDVKAYLARLASPEKGDAEKPAAAPAEAADKSEPTE